MDLPASVRFLEERAPERPFLSTKAQPWQSQINPLEEQHSLSPGTCLAKNTGGGGQAGGRGKREHELV